MRYFIFIVGMLLTFPGFVMGDDYTQEQILNEIRDMRYEQQYQRTLDSWTDSIRRTNRQIQETFKKSDWESNKHRYDSYEDFEADQWYPDPDGGLVIPGGHFE